MIREPRQPRVLLINLTMSIPASVISLSLVELRTWPKASTTSQLSNIAINFSQQVGYIISCRTVKFSLSSVSTLSAFSRLSIVAMMSFYSNYGCKIDFSATNSPYTRRPTDLHIRTETSTSQVVYSEEPFCQSPTTECSESLQNLQSRQAPRSRYGDSRSKATPPPQGFWLNKVFSWAKRTPAS